MAINIFYIDDEPILCEIFTDFFASDEVKVTTFTEPNVALQSPNAKDVDLIFVDYRMPKMSGDKLAEIFKNKLSQPVGFYLVTGEIDPKTQFQFDGIIKKPYEESTVNAIIQSKLKFKKAA